MRVIPFLGLVLYASYLIYAGLFFLLSPWSEFWPILLMRLPIHWAVVLDSTAVRGLISGMGLLHFGMAAYEFWQAMPGRSEH